VSVAFGSSIRRKMAANTLPFFFASLAGMFVGSTLQSMKTVGLKTRGAEQAIKTGTRTKGAKKAATVKNARAKKAIKKHKGKRQSSPKVDPVFDEDYLGMKLAELDEEIEAIKKTLSRVCARFDIAP